MSVPGLRARRRGIDAGRAIVLGLAGGLLAGTLLAAPHQPAIRMDVLWPYYHPSVATVPAKTPIAWVNPTSMPHTVTHDACGQGSPCAFHSGPVPPGDTFSIPGLPPGRYSYHCALHPSMRGVLVVRDVSVRMHAIAGEPDVRRALIQFPVPSR